MRDHDDFQALITHSLIDWLFYRLDSFRSALVASNPPCRLQQIDVALQSWGFEIGPA